MLTHVSLFSGIGGIDLAAEWAGFKTVLQVEKDKKCLKILSRHWPDVEKFEDIVGVGDEEFERFAGSTVLSAGFPCQPFSGAGKRKGIGDERYLWPEVVRAVRIVRPRWFVGENVRGLLFDSKGRTFGTVLTNLASLGYRVGWCCYGADEAAEAPHLRDRLFIVGYLADTVGVGPRGRRAEFELEAGREAKPENKTERPGRKLDWPPRPFDFDGWRKLLDERPDLRPALSKEEEIELQVCPETDGISRSVALNMLGNAVVPQQIYPIFEAIAQAECNAHPDRSV